MKNHSLNPRLKGIHLIIMTIGLLACSSSTQQSNTDDPKSVQWTTAEANDWYADQPWLVGTNFCPSYAINQLEMWQASTFDLEAIEKELALSASIGMNTHRVFLHDLLWEQDSTGLLNRIDQFLEVANKHGIKIMLVLFDGVWHPVPKLGTQPDPVPRKHNSGWVQSPGAKSLADPTTYPRLERYIKGVINRFKDDDRVVIWDLFNEPENANAGSYPDLELDDKYQRAEDLLKLTFEWAQEVRPGQPLTAGVWGGFIGRDGLRTDSITSITKLMLDQSDIISFHTYQGPEVPPLQIDFLQQFNRPILCTEYLARSRDNTFQKVLPLFKEHKIGAYNWGFVAGKTNTLYPWSSWDSVFTSEPDPWHHEIFREDFTPYKKEEVELIKTLTSNE